MRISLPSLYLRENQGARISILDFYAPLQYSFYGQQMYGQQWFDDLTTEPTAIWSRVPYWQPFLYARRQTLCCPFFNSFRLRRTSVARLVERQAIIVPQEASKAVWYSVSGNHQIKLFSKFRIPRNQPKQAKGTALVYRLLTLSSFPRGALSPRC